MRHAIIEGNRATTISATSSEIGVSGSTVEVDGGGTITDTRITRNTSVSVGAGGDAAVSGALIVLNFNGDPKLLTVRDSVIADNTSTASTGTGAATVQGVGVYNDSLLALKDVKVRGNRGRAAGPAGRAEGGGVWNSDELSGGPVELSLEWTAVTRNRLSGGSGITVQGGGLFTQFPVSLIDSVIAHNTPDQCFGCESPFASALRDARRGSAGVVRARLR